MKISFLVFLVSAIMLALFAPTCEAKGRILSIRKPNLGSFSRGISNSIRKPNFQKIAKPAQPGLI